MASKFVWVVMPLDIIEGIHESILDFLEVVEHEAYANILACIAAVTEVVLIWVGLHFYDADLVFIGLISLGNSAFFLVLNVMFCIGFGWLEKYENGLIRSLALRNRPLLKEFLKTSTPLAVGSMLAYAEWELLTVFAAVLGPAEAATWAVLGFVWDVFESTTEAFGDAGEVRVSYQLGKGRPQLARLSSYKSMFMGLAMSIVMSTIFLSLTNVLPEFLTTDQTIQDMLRMLFPMIALGNVTMSVGMVCWALVGAQLRYPLATAIATLCSFGITLPLGATFTIVLNYDLKGLTFAVIAGYVMTAMLLSTVLLMSDWEKLSERIREKVLADTVDEDSSSSDDSSSSSSSSSSSEGEEDDLQDKQLGGPLATKDVLANFDANSNMEDGGITHKKSEETDVSSVKAMHQAVQEDPNVSSPDRIINRVVTWWG
jgi:MATE family multidrug resistance protein